MTTETVHFYDDSETTLCGQSASLYINAMVETSGDFCPDCIRFLRDKQMADGLEFQWSAGEVCFDCPCGEKEIIMSEGGDIINCECGRIYKLVHYVALIQRRSEP